MVRNLECPAEPSADGLSLSIAWGAPSLNLDSVVVYEVIVKEYQQLQGTLDLTTVNLPTPFIEQVDAQGSFASRVTGGGISE